MYFFLKYCTSYNNKILPITYEGVPLHFTAFNIIEHTVFKLHEADKTKQKFT